ncbi:MAG: sulfite exporter TauE/SafE family protein [Sphingomonadales bacterium]|nr:sulfite exporter TauE/SafE family protein [Sphingomonadales bacterium]
MIPGPQDVLAIVSGSVVGFSLGLIGGGGSILAVPLIAYGVGLRDPHVAIGTSALAVAVNAFASLASHARARNVCWRCGGVFAGAGILGALAGSGAGKALDGQKLLFLFALLMIVVAGMMWRRRSRIEIAEHSFRREHLPRMLGFGFGTGALSGFFGIGGGFLIVPALVAASGMPLYRAIGTSLVAVGAFGLTTAASYAAAGLVDWAIASWFILGGVIGSFAGAAGARRLAADRARLGTFFAAIIVAVAAYMLWRSWLAFTS